MLQVMATEKVLTQPGNNEGVLSAPMVGIQTMGLYSPFPKDRTHSYRWNMLQVPAAEKVLTQPALTGISRPGFTLAPQ